LSDPLETGTGTAPPLAPAYRADVDPTPEPSGVPRSPRRHRPWKPPATGWVAALATVVCVGVVVGVTVWQLGGTDLLTNTTTTGGDTGAHFMMPEFLRQQLLPHGHLTGWDPGAYDGYPIYTLYFLLPDLLAALASYVIHYDVAFKLAVVAGSLLMPVAAWACGRLFRLRPPGPAALAAATLPFLFDYTFTIYGGNLFSTLAGEYSFTFSLSLAILFLGLFAVAVRTGRLRGWAAVVLAGCILAHIVPGAYALVGAAVLLVIELMPAGFLRVGDRPRATRRQVLWWGVSTVGIGVLLSGFWLVPFGIDEEYSTSMGYTNVTGYAHLFAPEADLWAIILAAVSVVIVLVRRDRFGVCVTVLGIVSAVGLMVDPQGSLYNVRLLPLWFISVYLLVGWGFAVVVSAVAVRFRRWRVRRWSEGVTQSPRARPAARWYPGSVGGALAAIFGACLVVVPPFVVPASWLPVTLGANRVSVWAHYNFVGYEGQPGYPEYRGVIETMKKVGATDGCGRAMWEYSPSLNRFGTPWALTLLPYWTDNCIDSMEGLLMESSATTPYHFLDQSELSAQPSDPMVGLDYGPVNVPLGVLHLQLLGVRYFMASSPQVEAQAVNDPSLRLVATSGPWHSTYGGGLTTTWDIFEVRNSPLVTPLTDDPAVLRGISPRQGSWLPPSESWYLDPARWKVELAQSGPAGWPRVAPSDHNPPRRAVPRTTVSGIHQGISQISFEVSRVGTPVLVKTSYFPNWRATGAMGPYRVTPNLMVVVPTSHSVTLTYGTTTANDLGEVATILGLLGLVGCTWAWYRRRQGAVSPVPAGARRPGGRRNDPGTGRRPDEPSRTPLHPGDPPRPRHAAPPGAAPNRPWERPDPAGDGAG